MFRYLPLIAKNCWRNRRRTILTILSVAASLSLLGVLMAMYAALYISDPPPESARRLMTRNKVSLVFTMPEAYVQKIRRLPGVVETMEQNWFGGMYKDSRPENLFARFAIEPDKLFTIRGEMKMPEDQKAAFLKERTACIVGKALADRLNFKVGDHITIQGDIFPINLELNIRGIYEEPINNEALYFNRKYLDESINGAMKNQVGMIVSLADSADSVPRIARAADDEFRNSTIPTKTEPEQAFALSFINAMGNIKAFLLSICAAVTFTVLLVSGNTMAMSVRERVREVGVLKTLGFTRQTILGMILGEAALLALLGGVLGLVIASGLCGLMRRAPAFISQLKTLSIHPLVAVICLAVATAIGLISSLVPALGASRTPIVEALRRND